MRRIKLTLQRQPRNYTRPGQYAWSQGHPRVRSTRECLYTLVNGRGEHIIEFCSSLFHAATGFRLEPGEEKLIEIQIKAVA